MPAKKGANRGEMTAEVQQAIAWLEQKSTPHDLDNLGRFGIAASNPIGVSMANVHEIAKRLGRSHELAGALWDTGLYEARLLTAFVDEPARVTAAQMDRWCRDFDNWGICDTLCFKLFDRTSHAWDKVPEWSGRPEEFVRRAAFALLASLALHDKKAADAQFIDGLILIERAATDERNFVKKGVSWALRAVGRRNAVVHTAAMEVVRRLMDSADSTARWIGKDALRDLQKPAVAGRFGGE